jgi:hypothetical protein
VKQEPENLDKANTGYLSLTISLSLSLSFNTLRLVKQELENFDKANTGFIDFEILHGIVSRLCYPMSKIDFQVITKQVRVRVRGRGRVRVRVTWNSHSSLLSFVKN